MFRNFGQKIINLWVLAPMAIITQSSAVLVMEFFFLPLFILPASSSSFSASLFLWWSFERIRSYQRSLKLYPATACLIDSRRFLSLGVKMIFCSSSSKHLSSVVVRVTTMFNGFGHYAGCCWCWWKWLITPSSPFRSHTFIVIEASGPVVGISF